MPKGCFVNVPAPKQWELSLELVERVKAVGMVGVQVPRALKVLARGEVLVTWRREDGSYHFCGVKR